MRPINELTSLNRNHLHIFVVGPGFGEGIAVALPGSGWLFVDGCRTLSPGTFSHLPLVEIYEAYRSNPDIDSVQWMILTHPHEDHAVGFAEALDFFEPERVGLVGLAPPGRSLWAEAQSWVEREINTLERIRQSQVLTAFRVLKRRQDNGQNIERLVAGCRLDGIGDSASVWVRAPFETAAEQILARGVDDWNQIRKRANSLSIVLEVRFGDSQILLGADQITKPDRKTGWKTIFKDDPNLALAHAVKLPHHASVEAHHPKLNEIHQRGTSWVTPYSRTPLPRAEKDLKPFLSTTEGIVRLTSMPTQAARQAAQNASRLTLNSYARYTAPRRQTGFATGATAIDPPRPMEPLEPVWAASFDREGRISGHWRGTAAVEILKANISPESGSRNVEYAD